MEPKRLVLTAVGHDRPGLAARISAIAAETHCNVEDSRMALLAGEFAMLVLLSADAEALNTFRKRAEEDTSLTLSLSFYEPYPAGPQPGHITTLDVAGPDTQGIVQRITATLVEHEINIISLSTHVERAAFSGTPLFKLRAHFSAPSSLSNTTLRAQLDSVCDVLALEYTLTKGG